MRIFISSTVYDLIDVRAELRSLFDELGLETVMSDEPTSAFWALPDVNSIETCLINLRRSDACVVILSQRYGSVISSRLRLARPLSATHLEYITAQEEKIPVFCYVRDRLRSEYEMWRKAGKPEDVQGLGLLWTPELGHDGQPNAVPMFKFIKEHVELSQDAKNWRWSFTDSLQLKRALAKDLQLFSLRARLERRRNENLLPHLVVTYGVREGEAAETVVTLSLINNSSVGACQVEFVCDGEVRRVPFVAPGEKYAIAGCIIRGDHVERPISVSYSTGDGIGIREAWRLFVKVVPGGVAEVECARVSLHHVILKNEQGVDVVVE